MAKTNTPAGTPDQAANTVKARILIACALGEPNDVIEIDAEQADTMIGVVDADPAAVAYAESLGQ